MSKLPISGERNPYRTNPNVDPTDEKAYYPFRKLEQEIKDIRKGLETISHYNEITRRHQTEYRGFLIRRGKEIMHYWVFYPDGSEVYDMRSAFTTLHAAQQHIDQYLELKANEIDPSRT
jgi:hypothetical protein